MSYLSGTYLDEEVDYDADRATVGLSPALGDDPTSEMITLPGCVILPRKTFWIVVAALVVIALILIIKKMTADKAPE